MALYGKILDERDQERGQIFQGGGGGVIRNVNFGNKYKRQGGFGEIGKEVP